MRLTVMSRPHQHRQSAIANRQGRNEMAAWQIMGSGVVVLLAAGTGLAQNYPLVEAVKPGACFQYQMEMGLTGDMRIVKEAKPAALKLRAQAKHAFDERVLVVSSTGMPQKLAR